jgi:hypothetical protein
MKGLVFLGVTLLSVGAAFAGYTDAAPGAPPVVDTPEVGTDAWGQLIRSFTILPASGTNSCCAVATNDGYFITGMWNSFSAFYVYTTTGSFVRSVSASSPSGGNRDGTFRCHLGTGYFVCGGGGPGMYGYFKYTAGGNPASSASGNLMSAGRGVAWDGTYYVAISGSWSSPLARYTTTGSQVGTLPIGSGVAMYGIAAHPAKPNNLYCSTHLSGYPLREYIATTGSMVRSFSVGGQAGGTDAGWNDGYLYCVSQSPRSCFVRDGELGSPGVAPKSLGTIRAVFH